MKERDQTIDRLRGLAMLWVIVVHALYWGDFFDNHYINLLKSFFLFEMPLFFFVTGASNSFSKMDDYFKYVQRRYSRILIPYWFFSVICAGLSIAYFELTEGITFSKSVIVLFSWLIPFDCQITSLPYLTWALWFIPVYLCVVLVIPLFKRMRESSYARCCAVVLIIIFLTTCLFNLGWIQNVAFYSFWTYMGLFYRDIMLRINQQNFRKKIGWIIIVGAVVLFVLFMLGWPIDMQYNKFPPNIMFGIFSIIMMSLVFLAVPYINKLYDRLETHKRICKMLELYSTRSMTIFLYQVFAFVLTNVPLKFLVPNGGIVVSILKATICLITTVPICAILAVIFGRVEQIKRKA